jgi:hypothetical protein
MTEIIEQNFISGAITVLRRRAELARERADRHRYTIEHKGRTIAAMRADGVIEERNVRDWSAIVDELEGEQG